MSNKEALTISQSHFTMNGYGQGMAFPGVERVMATHEQILQSYGNRLVRVQTVVGATDCDNPLERGIIVVPGIRSNPEWGWSNGDVEIDEARVSSTLTQLAEVFKGGGVIFHNTTNSSKHNVPFGVAAARYVTEHSNAVMWIHDLRGSNACQIRALLPDRAYARLVCVSNARRASITRTLQDIELSGVQLPKYELVVVPNPIDSQFFTEKVPSTTNLHELAPNYAHFTQASGLRYDPEQAQQLLFGDDSVRFLVPARIVHNKGIREAIETAKQYHQLTKDPVTLIVTGPPDLRKADNQQYWRNELLPELQRLDRNNGFQVLTLGGVEWQYMPDLATKCHAVLAPFVNEGFCMPLIENGLKGVPSIINQDEAMIETTDGHALILSQHEWGTPNAAHSIHQYLSGNQSQIDVDAIKHKAWSQLHPSVVAEQILSVLNI